MRPEENGAENSLRDAALEWCFLNGLVVRAKPGAAAPGLNPAALATHAPVTLFPALLPRHAYAEAVRLQPLFNHLIDAIARDHSFLTEVMERFGRGQLDFGSRGIGESRGDRGMECGRGRRASVSCAIAVLAADHACYDIYKKVHAEGSTQRVVLGLHRSDYLLHDDGKSHLQIQQVEVNTISASFASLSTKTADLHRYLQERFPKVYSDRYPSIAIPGPVNTSLKSLPKGIASAFNLYGVKDAIVVMVVQPRWMEQELQNHFVFFFRSVARRVGWDQLKQSNVLFRYGITLIRKTMADLDKEATLSGDDRKLFLGEKEVAVVYYRSAYTPDDYPTQQSGPQDSNSSVPTQSMPKHC
ncbi:eukaryotic glutathione synthase, partial [Zopfochytrium polystomum]